METADLEVIEESSLDKGSIPLLTRKIWLLIFGAQEYGPRRLKKIII